MFHYPLRSFVKNSLYKAYKTSSNLIAMISSCAESETEVFQGVMDHYQGLKVHTSESGCSSREEFKKKLQMSMDKWIEAKVRSVWFDIRIEDTEFVPVLAADGFKFHHSSHSNEVTMVKWIASGEPNLIPDYAHTLVGVGGLVVNEHDEVLVITERFSISKKPLWKLPGGYVDPGENLDVAVVREVLEETGVETELASLVAFRHAHKANFGCSDLYFAFCLKPLSKEINMSKEEISSCKWMPLQEFSNHPDVIPMNRFFAKKYIESKTRRTPINKVDMELNLSGFRRQLQIYAVGTAEDD